MGKLVKFLKPFIFSLLIAVGLLYVQALLTLNTLIPNYAMLPYLFMNIMTNIIPPPTWIKLKLKPEQKLPHKK